MTSKIPDITLFFWILKIIATTLGETAGDMLSMTLNMGYIASFCLTGVLLILLLVAHVRSQHAHPYLFWTTVIGTTTVGTEISDMMDRTFHLGYFWGSIVLISCLGITFALWYIKEKSLRVDTLTSRSQEIFFWVAVVCSNSLGTAFGDFLTDNLALSYIMGACVTSLVIGGVLCLHYMTRINAVILFWIAFIFTRPFGATFGDFLTKPHALGGLALDRIESTALLLIVFWGIMHMTHKSSKVSLDT